MSGFVMVPAWFRRRKPSAAAMLTYVTLASYGRFDTETAVYEECRPSVATLAEACGMAPATVKRALAELYGMGAVERRQVIEPGQGQRPSVYRVIFGSVEGPEPALVLPDEMTGGTDLSQGGGSDLSHRVTSENADLSHRSVAHTGGSNGGGSDLSHEEEPLSTKISNPQEINTVALAREPERDDFSPGFLTTSSGDGVSSGHTPSPVAEFGRSMREQTEEIMGAWQTWIGRNLPQVVVVEVSKIVKRCVGDGVERNTIALGLKDWTEAGMIAPKFRLPQAIAARASAPVHRNPAAAKPTRAEERRQRLTEAVAKATGSPELIDTMRQQSVAAGFGGGAILAAIEGQLA